MAHNNDILFLGIFSYVQANQPTTKWWSFCKDLLTSIRLSSLADVMVHQANRLNLDQYN